jgi:hypothetical protein
MKKIFTTINILCCISNIVLAQTPIVQRDLDINNVRATILTHGDLFWDRVNQTAGYEFPKGSGLHSNFLTALWVAGYDQNTSNLHVASQTYRQGGNDYWPGPIDNGSQIDSITSTKWDKIWKIDKADIDQFLTIIPHTVFNTHPAILDWPAKGNPYATDRFGASLSITKSMAPFVDANQDGVYNALDGDYPSIKGEQALWWVFNDQKQHTESAGEKLNLEFKAMAYACNIIPALKNSTYYSFDITNYNNAAFLQTRIGLFSCANLGYAFDDYIGVDTFRRFIYLYNGDSKDEGPSGYDSNLTKHGLAIIQSPQDSVGYKAPLGAFTFMNPTNGITGFPTSSYGINNFMRGFWKDGQPFTDACNARDIDNITSFVYTGNPIDSNQWSEKQCNNTPSTRVFLLSTSDFTFLPGETKNFTFAAINTPRSPHTYSITDIQNVADAVMMYPNGCNSSSPSILKNYNLAESIMLYPNPANHEMVLSWIESYYNDKIKSFEIVNTYGETIHTPSLYTNSNIKFNISSLANGIYILKLKTDQESTTIRFLKN